MSSRDPHTHPHLCRRIYLLGEGEKISRLTRLFSLYEDDRYDRDPLDDICTRVSAPLWAPRLHPLLVAESVHIPDRHSSSHHSMEMNPGKSYDHRTPRDRMTLLRSIPLLLSFPRLGAERGSHTPLLTGRTPSCLYGSWRGTHIRISHDPLHVCLYPHLDHLALVARRKSEEIVYEKCKNFPLAFFSDLPIMTIPYG